MIACSLNNCGMICPSEWECQIRLLWYDELKAECDMNSEKLGLAPVLTLMAALLCLVIAVTHILLQCMPPLANSFFIFNANEDNRLYVKPLLKPTDQRASQEIEQVKRDSLIPTLLSTSSESGSESQSENIARELRHLSIVGQDLSLTEESQTQTTSRRTTAMATMKSKLQETIRAVTRAKSKSKSQGPFII